MHRSKKWISIFVSLFLLSYAETLVFADTQSSSSPQSYAVGVKRAMPSVVNVFTDRAIKTIPNASNNFGKKRLRRVSLGSAVVIDAKGGYLLTNYHVVRQAERILVALDDGRREKATLVGVDQETDLAVLRVDLKSLVPAILADSDNVEVGDVVLAIGNPFGLGQTVTQGVVSAMGRNTIGINQLEDYIQTDAAINPGNSGGALIRTDGELIGINTGIYSRSGGFQGIGFAIPINVALNVMQQIIKTGGVVRGWLGLDVHTLSSHQGVLVGAILNDSPAGKAGIKPKDIILLINHQRIRTARGFLTYVAQREPGSKVVLVYLRNGQRNQVEVILGKRPQQPIIDDRGLIISKPE